jgi:pSer/pThr/pTyr-binding forkhead associated (FHA) protein
MRSGNFTIGRNPDCELVVANDPKCSRQHASVTWVGSGYEIVGLSDANPIFANGRQVDRHLLVNGDILLIGSTEFQFNLTTQPTNANVQLRRLAVAPGALGNPRSTPTSARRRTSSKKSSPMTFIYVIIGLVVLYMVFGGSSAKKKKKMQLRGQEQIEEAIESAQKLQESALKSGRRMVDDSLMGRQAQENYVRGFRDFRKGQYERALDSFNTCLALSPSHVLCNRYKLLSQRKFNELVQLQIVLGRRRRDQNQFKACMASFRNVMVMVKDANSASYREAKANYDACHALSEGRY